VNIKRYVVSDMHEAVALIKRDLGPEAVIISSRQIRPGGWKGFFTRPQLEVTAAVDDRHQPAVEPLPRHDPSPPRVPAAPNTFRSSWSNQPVSQGGGQDHIARELAELKDLLRRALKGGGNREMCGELEQWRRVLLDLEVTGDVTERVLQGIAETAGLSSDPQAIKQQMLRQMADMLPAGEGPISHKVCAFIGPTGVGKTTTLAKIAAQMAIFEQKRLALVTLDTYRIGAVEQLRTYGEIMGLPVEVVMSPRELKLAMERFWDRDTILIDTVGRSSNNRVGITELKGFLEVLPASDIFLVLSSTTKTKDLFKAVEAYRPLNYNKLIFTKLDETDNLGALLNTACSAGCPVAYVTTGQGVPDDIQAVEPKDLAKLILGAVG